MLALMREAAAAIRSHRDQVVVLFLDAATGSTLDTERALGAAILRHLRRHDRVPWPHGAPADPMDPRWVFWFEGVDFFINMSTPGHRRRRSRNLCSAFTLVVQSRSAFDAFAGDADPVRAHIRSRIAAHDAMPPHPALGAYGDPCSREAAQYFLGDDNEIVIDLIAEADISPSEHARER